VGLGKRRSGLRAQCLFIPKVGATTTTVGTRGATAPMAVAGGGADPNITEAEACGTDGFPILETDHLMGDNEGDNLKGFLSTRVQSVV